MLQRKTKEQLKQRQLKKQQKRKQLVKKRKKECQKRQRQQDLQRRKKQKGLPRKTSSNESKLNLRQQRKQQPKKLLACKQSMKKLNERLKKNEPA